MMKRDDGETSQYFQAVSRFFYEQRGAPFFLSSKEIENIRKWKNMGIPLKIVLEGIKDCFVTHRGKSGRKGKILSLINKINNFLKYPVSFLFFSIMSSQKFRLIVLHVQSSLESSALNGYEILLLQKWH